MSRRSSGVDEFHDTVESSPLTNPPATKAKAKAAPKKKKQTAPVVLRGPSFDVYDANACVALLNHLADCITHAVQEGKSVTSGNKSLIVAAALEIKDIVSSIPSLVAAPPTPTPPTPSPSVAPPSPQRNTEIDIKVEVIAAIRSELNKIKRETEEIKEIVTEINSKPQTTAPPHITQMSYASALASRKVSPQPNFPVMVESSNPNEDVINTVKTSVDVISLGVGVNQIRKTKSGKVIVSCDDENGRNTLQRALKERNGQLTVGIPAVRNPMLRLIGVTQEMSDTNIEDAVLKQNSSRFANLKTEEIHFKVIRRSKGKNNTVSNIIVQASPAVWNNLVDSRLRIGYQIIPVIDQSPLLQCYNCLNYGHRAQDCTNSVCCGHCAQPHDSRECPNREKEPTCCNCKKSYKEANHAAYSQKCPEWQRWDRFARVGINYA